jgi:hypothetical protein
VKTHSLWRLRRLPGRRAREWTSPHGFKWRVDRTGTHRVDNQSSEDEATLPDRDPCIDEGDDDAG